MVRKNDTASTIMVRGVPPSLHRKFKAACASIGMPMQDVMIKIIKEFVNPGIGSSHDVPKKVHRK